MSDAFWVALLGIPILVLTALIPLWKQRIDNNNAARIRKEDRDYQDRKDAMLRDSLHAVKANVDAIEKNTNSLTVRNEAIARKLGLAEGEQIGRAAGAAEAVVLAEGQRQGAETERTSAEAQAKSKPV
jgi:tetrahydromethanopterin S-methyltransferase subunit F